MMVVDPNDISERKSTITNGSAKRYLSKRLSNTRGTKINDLTGKQGETATKASDNDARSVLSGRSYHSRPAKSQISTRGAQYDKIVTGNDQKMGVTARTAEKRNAQPQGVSSKSFQDMNRFYQTANNLYKINTPTAAAAPILSGGDTKALSTSSQDDDVRTIIGLALNRK